ncbi:MAG: hypothetical protein IT453_22415 [Planctomycetes bacterium]|nr:hypothetical protein [Planctomycetota bacterium]
MDTDTVDSVELAADGTYRWAYSGGGVLSGGALLIDVEERGRWRVARGWIEFECEQVLDHGLASDRRLSSCGIVACWRGRRCFLPERDIVAFANVLNSGFDLSPRFLLAETPEGATYPQSEFTLPPEYAGYVLAEPVIATVLTSVDRRALGESGDRVEFTLDRGAADGLRVGHELWTLDLPSADEIPWSGRLVEVGEHRSRGRMRFTPFVPTVGTRMSTRDPRAER